MEDLLIIAKNILDNNQDLLQERFLEMQVISEALLPILDEEEIQSYQNNLLEKSLVDYMSFLSAHYGYPLDESMLQYIDSKGNRGQRKDRKTRSILANKNPDRNKIDRMVSQIKGSKTRKAHVSTQTRGNRKRAKTMRKRKGVQI